MMGEVTLGWMLCMQCVLQPGLLPYTLAAGLVIPAASLMWSLQSGMVLAVYLVDMIQHTFEVPSHNQMVVLVMLL